MFNVFIYNLHEEQEAESAVLGTPTIYISWKLLPSLLVVTLEYTLSIQVEFFMKTTNNLLFV